MKNINTVTMVGRLTRDADLQYTASGFPIAALSVAVNDSVKRGESYVDEVSFFDCKLFGKIASSLSQHLMKGKQVAITGKLKQERWEKDGKKNSRVVVNISDIELLGGTGGQQSEPRQHESNGRGGSFDDDLPF